MERVAVVYVLADLASVCMVRFGIDKHETMGIKNAEHLIQIFVDLELSTIFEGPSKFL